MFYLCCKHSKRIIFSTYLSIACSSESPTTPNGTRMCNQCAMLPWNKSFIREVILKQDAVTLTSIYTPNCHLSTVQKDMKLRNLANTIRSAKQRIRRLKIKTRGIDAVKRAHERKDIQKFIMEVNYIAKKGCLEERKVMWSYIKDVVRAEYLRVKNGNGQYSKGMRWSQDSKDLFTSQKIMGGKRMNKSQRENVGGPSLKTVRVNVCNCEYTYKHITCIFQVHRHVSKFWVPMKSGLQQSTQQGHIYGIGWGHRDLEYRRTIVTVYEIDDSSVVFCISGLRARKQGYYPTLNKAEALQNAICLEDWISKHPEDAEP